MDKSLAVLLGKVSRFIYKPSDDELPALDGPSVKLFQDPGPIPSSFAGVLRYPDKTVVVFKGTVKDPVTSGVRDWLANFGAALVPALGLPGLIHLGFADQLRLIHHDVAADLDSGFTPPLYVTGHSQGGAVAAVATKAFEQRGIEVAETYTFAAPLHGLTLPLEMALKASPQLKDLLGHISTTLGYVSVGKLTYGAPGQSLRVNVSPVEEKALRLKRLTHLATAGKNVFAHHAMLPHYIDMVS